MKKILLTSLLTSVMTSVIIGITGVIFLMNGVNITIEKKEQEYTEMVIIDETIVQDKSYVEFLSYEARINLEDGLYVDK